MHMLELIHTLRKHINAVLVVIHVSELMHMLHEHVTAVLVILLFVVATCCFRDGCRLTGLPVFRSMQSMAPVGVWLPWSENLILAARFGFTPDRCQESAEKVTGAHVPQSCLQKTQKDLHFCLSNEVEERIVWNAF